MRAGAGSATIGVMRIPRLSHRNRGRSPYGIVGSELAGALAAASQMALLCPPGFDEWVRRELAGDGAAPHGTTTLPSAR